MAVSYANVDGSKMELTPMRVSYRGVDLGGTLSNVVVEMKYEKAEIKADQLGSTVMDRRVKGFICTVTTEFTQVQDKLNIWKAVFPHANHAGTAPADAMDFNSAVGDGDLINSGLLTLHPLSQIDSVLDYDFTFFKATADAQSSITYGPDKQATIKIIFNVLPDTSVVPPRFMRYGNPGTIFTPAAFAAAVAGGGNVGNGTVSGISVNNATTKTETWTLTCIDAIVNAGIFSVVGSVTGARGVAYVGTAYHSNSITPSQSEINFLINDGATDFAVGDTFTIATTAAV
jgi:hypothetical protein